MSAPLARRVILLCDASESADALVAAGARLYLVESSATSVAQTVARIGHNDVDGLEADPSDPTALDRAVSRATKRFGAVNAAVLGPLWHSSPVPPPIPRLEPQPNPHDLIAQLTSTLTESL